MLVKTPALTHWLVLAIMSSSFLLFILLSSISSSVTMVTSNVIMVTSSVTMVTVFIHSALSRLTRRALTLVFWQTFYYNDTNPC